MTRRHRHQPVLLQINRHGLITGVVPATWCAGRVIVKVSVMQHEMGLDIGDGSGGVDVA